MARTARLELEVDGRRAQSGASAADRELSKLKRSGRDALEALAGIASASDLAAAGLRRAGTGANSADKEMRETAAQAGRTSTAFRRLGDDSRRSGDSMRRAASDSNLLGNSWNKLRSIAATLALGLVAKSIFETTREFRALDQSMTIALGSSEKAAQEMAFVEQVSDKLGFRVRDVARGYVGLAAAAKGTNLEGQKTRDIFEAITSAGAAYSLTSDQITGALTAVQQIMSKGKVSAEELRRQVGERLYGAFQIAARGMGLTTSELDKMLSTGNLLSTDFLPRFAQQLRKEIPDGAEVAGAGFNRFLTQLDKASVVIGESGFFDALNEGFGEVSVKLKEMADDGSLAKIGSGLADLVKIALFLVDNFEALVAAFVTYKVITIAVTAATVGFQAALLPLTAIIAGITIGALVLGLNNTADAADRARASIAASNNDLAAAQGHFQEAANRANDAGVNIAFLGRESDGSATFVQTLGGNAAASAKQVRELAAASREAAINAAALRGVEISEKLAKVRANIIPDANSTPLLMNALYGVARPIYEAFGGDSQTTLRARERDLLSQQSLNTREQTALRLTPASGFEAAKETPPPPPAGGAGGGTGGTTPGGRNANAEVGRDWSATEVADMLRTKGFRITDTNRTAAQQQAQIDKWEREDPRTRGIRPAGLDGPHVRGKGVDIGREHSVGSIKAALKEAGVPIGKLINEGDHKHLTIGGRGGANGGKSEAEIEADRLAKLAETRKQNEDNFYQQLKDQAIVAGLLPDEAERYNKELELRRILNDGQEAGEKQISDEQRQQIDNALKLRDLREFDRSIRAATLAGDREGARLAEITVALSGQDKQIVEDNLRIQEKLWPFREAALEKGLDLTEESTAAALAELEARERANIALERKNDLIRKGVDIAQDYKTPAMQKADDILEVGAKKKALADALDAKAITDELYEAAIKGLDQAVYEISHRFEYEFIDSIDALASHFEGKFGDVVNGLAGILQTIAAQTKGDFSQSGVIGGVIGLFSGPDGNPVADAATKASQTAMDKILKGGMWSNPIGDLKASFGGFKGDIKNIFGKGGDFTKGLGNVLGNAAIGAKIGDTTDKLFKLVGVKSSNTGAQIGGAAGMAAFGPIGSIVGSIAGGLIGGLFKKSKTGSATISGIDDEASLSGNNSGMRKAAGGLADQIQVGLRSIADRLGADIGSFKVSIGVRDGAYRVDPSGGGNTKTKKGAIDFGDDAGAAVLYAIRDAIKDGALSNLSPTIQRVIQMAGDDLEKGLSNALKLKSVKDELRSLEDPMNFALETLNKGFQEIVDLLRSAGGTAEEFADAEKLYQLRRQDLIEKGNDNALKAMEEYVFSLTGGTSSPLSPELRYATSRGRLDDLDAKKAAGGTVSFDDYKSASDAFLAASRDSKGSGLGYFQDLARVTTTIGEMIQQQKTAVLSTPPIDFTPVVSAVDRQTEILAGLLSNIANSVVSGYSGSSGGFDSRVNISEARFYAEN